MIHICFQEHFQAKSFRKEYLENITSLERLFRVYYLNMYSFLTKTIKRMPEELCLLIPVCQTFKTEQRNKIHNKLHAHSVVDPGIELVSFQTVTSDDIYASSRYVLLIQYIQFSISVDIIRIYVHLVGHVTRNYVINSVIRSKSIWKYIFYYASRFQFQSWITSMETYGYTFHSSSLVKEHIGFCIISTKLVLKNKN